MLIFNAFVHQLKLQGFRASHSKMRFCGRRIVFFLTHICQDKPLFTKHLFFSSPCSDPLKPPRQLPSSPAQNVLHARVPFLSRNLSCMWGLWTSCKCSSHACVLNLVTSYCWSVSYLFDYRTSQKNLEGRRKFAPPHKTKLVFCFCFPLKGKF